MGQAPIPRGAARPVPKLGIWLYTCYLRVAVHGASRGPNVRACMMAESKVTYCTMDMEEAKPGEEQLFGFACPSHAGRTCEGLFIAGKTGLKHDGQNQND